MRAAIVVTVALMLAVGSTVALAQTQDQTQPQTRLAPLPSGQPAGLEQAQRGNNTLPIMLGVGAVVAGIALVAANDNDASNPVVPTTTTAP